MLYHNLNFLPLHVCRTTRRMRARPYISNSTKQRYHWSLMQGSATSWPHDISWRYFYTGEMNQQEADKEFGGLLDRKLHHLLQLYDNPKTWLLRFPHSHFNSTLNPILSHKVKLGSAITIYLKWKVVLAFFTKPIAPCSGNSFFTGYLLLCVLHGLTLRGVLQFLKIIFSVFRLIQITII